MTFGHGVKITAFVISALVVAWMSTLAVAMYRDPEMAILAFTTNDTYPRIPASLASKFLRYAPYNPNATSILGQPIFSAACAGYGLLGVSKQRSLEVLSTLGAKGANVDARHHGLTSLQAAVLSSTFDNDPDLVSLLLSLGADPSLRVVRPGKPINGMTTIEFAEYLDAKPTIDIEHIVALLKAHDT